MSKSVRELELIIQRLNSQIDSKNEQIAELNDFIQKATDNTQELIRNFRAFCIKVLESELAYGDITSRDLESMSLNDLLSRAKDMLKQNQEKARGIYDTFKQRLTQKNQMIQGLTDQVSQLKYMLDNIEKTFEEPFEEPDDEKRTSAYLLDTDASLDSLKPAMSMSTVVEENERVVSFDKGSDNEVSDMVMEGQMYVQNINSITDQMKDEHWKAFEFIVKSGVSETTAAKDILLEKFAAEGNPISPDKATRLIRFLVTLMVMNQTKVSTGIRWFTVLTLTEVGRKLYIERYKAYPPESEYQKILKEHGSAEHGYTIKDVVQILNDTGKYRTVSMSRKGNTIRMPSGKVCIPDVVACMKDSVEYYEIECGNHHQSDFEDKCNKLIQITQNLFFIAQNRDIAEKKLKPQIEGWIKSADREHLRIAGIVVYLTSISDLANQKWTYIYNMQDEEPIYILDDLPKEKGGK